MAMRMSVAAFRIVPIPIDSASRGTRAGSPPNSAALSRRVVSAQRHAMRARHELVARLVEADVAVRADAENLQVDAAAASISCS